MSRENDLPKVYFQLALFTSDAKVIWSRSMPNILPSSALSMNLHAFICARSISDALLSGIQHPVTSNTKEDERQISILRQRNVSLRGASDTLVVHCQDGDFIAGYPMDSSNELWLGFFSAHFPPVDTDNICSILSRIALYSELGSPINELLTSKLDLFWTCLTDFSRLHAAKDDQLIAKTMKYLRCLDETPLMHHVWPKKPPTASASLADRFDFPESMLERLQSTGQSDQAKSTIAVCLFSHDGVVFHEEGMTRSEASVYGWRYRTLAQSFCNQEHCEYFRGSPLRIWFASPSFCMCVHFFESTTTESGSSPENLLACIRRKVLELLPRVETFVTDCLPRGSKLPTAAN